MRIGISGTGIALPETVVTNDDMSRIVETSDEWIMSRTGISERRIATSETATSMAVDAARGAIADAGLSPSDIDFILVATFSAEALIPNAACHVADALGMAGTPGYDVNAACTGFVYALTTAYNMIKSGDYKHVLCIGTERLSGFTDWTDRRTCVLFGDGAGACVVSADMGHSITHYTLRNVLDKEDGIRLSNTTRPYLYRDKVIGRNVASMQGKPVYRFATAAICALVDDLLAKAALTVEDIKMFVPHQANARIIKYAAQKLKLGLERFYINIDRYGNTSCASIIIALHEVFNQCSLNIGDKLVLVAFGGGYTSGGLLLEV